MAKEVKQETNPTHITNGISQMKKEHDPEDNSTGLLQKNSESSTNIGPPLQDKNVDANKEATVEQLTLDMIGLETGKKRRDFESSVENPSNKEQVIQKFKDVFGIEPSETETCNRLAQCWNDQNDLEKFIKDRLGNLHRSVEFISARSSDNKVTIKEGFPYVVIGKTQ